jgi:membrane-bound lytic murein transglycosylase
MKLSPQEYIYVCLVRGSMAKYDAYMIAYDPKDDSIQSVKQACSALELKPEIAKIFRKMQDDATARSEFEKKIKTLNRKLRTANKKLKEQIEEEEMEEQDKGEKVEKMIRDASVTKDKNSLLKELEFMQSTETDTNIRLKILGKIADIQQMKKQEEKSEDDIVHYYLPLNCKDCSLYKKHYSLDKKKKRE